MQLIGSFFGVLLRGCYRLVSSYGLAIFLFTLLSKLFLLPVSILVQKNSIKMVQLMPELNRIKAKWHGDKEMISSEQVRLYQEHQYHPMLDLVPVIVQLFLLMGVVNALYLPMPEVSTLCLGLDLSQIPREQGGLYFIIPGLAAFSAWLMCFTQNKSNVLQSEQGKVNQWTTMGISVALSLYLGIFVPGGVGLYWTFGNLLSILQMYLLNYFISPKKYIDYEALRESQELLAKAAAEEKTAQQRRSKAEIEREKADYKRFLRYPMKQIVFLSEKNGFYKYYRGIIEYLIRKTDIVIHYVTSDPTDSIFEMTSEQLKTYYIGEKQLIILMMKMDADIVVMTTPDLQRYHIKRSMLRDDIEYIYTDHAIASPNLTLRSHALDHYDTIFSTGSKMTQELREMEKVYGLPEKRIVSCGYTLLDEMIADYSRKKEEKGEVPEILIAPSWQKDNLMDSCIESLLEELTGQGYHITVRPHPQYVRHRTEELKKLEEHFAAYPDIELQKDFSSNKTVFDADVLITDWSGIAYEYSFTTCKPTLFINTPMKIMNPDYQDIDVVPFDIEARDQVGISLNPEDLGQVRSVVQRLLTEELYSSDSIAKVRAESLYHIGESAAVCGNYLIRALQKRVAEGTEKSAAEEKTEKETQRSTTYLQRFIAWIQLLLFPAVAIGILGPLEVYAGNVGEMYIGTGDLIWMFLGASLLAVLIGAALLALLPEKLQGIPEALCFAVSMICYVQNLFLNKKLIKTDGSKVDWSIYHDYTIINTVVWILVIVLLCVGTYLLKEKRRKVLCGFSVFFTAVQMVAIISILLKNPYSVVRDEMYALDGQDEFHLASGNNVIVLILDRYCNDSFDEMLEDYPEKEELFKDFTYYNNANSRYNYTFPSVVYMLTHVEPDCSRTTVEYKSQAWQEGLSQPFHDTLASRGYSVRYFSSGGRLQYTDPSDVIGSLDNVTYIDNVAYRVDYPYLFYIMAKTSLLKYAPYLCKPYLEVQSFQYEYIVKYEGIPRCIDDNGEYYAALCTEGLSVDESMENALTITHLLGIHNPYTINALAEPVSEEETNCMEVQLGLNVILEEYFDQLKALGIYDSSTIILTADHGHYFDTLDLQPIYLIKPAGQVQEAMTVNEAPISSEDFLATVLDLIGEDYSLYGTSIFDWQEGEQRERISCFPNDGFDVVRYTGNREDFREAVQSGNYTHIQATEDWN